MKELQAIVQALCAPEARESVLATLVSVQGSSYRRPGARLLLRDGCPRLGSISGGCLEEDVIARSKRVLQTGIPEAVVYDTTAENDLVWGVGLGCHGIVRVLLEKLPPAPAWARSLAANQHQRQATTLAVRHNGPEPLHWGTRMIDDRSGALAGDPATFVNVIPPPVSLVVFGAGDDAGPLVRLAKELGWQVTVADPRAAFATSARFPLADLCLAAAANDLVDRVNPGPDALAVVMTHHYVHDLPLLRSLLARPLAYLGLLGPRKRADKLCDDLVANGFPLSPAQRSRLHAPVGLDLGADGPEQVALAIVAEMQAVLGGRSGQPLRERKGPIHG